MKAVRFVVFVLLSGFLGQGFSPPVFGSETDSGLTGAVTVGDLISYAYRANPFIEAAREGWKAVVEDYRIATGYPDPELNLTYYPEPIESRLGPLDWSAALNQRIPFPGKLTRAGRVVEAEARVAHIKLDRAVKGVIASVRESFHELLYIRTARQVADHNLTLLEHLRKVGETAYARDRAALMDMVKAQSQLGQLNYDRILLDDLELTEKTRLNGLLNRPPESRIGRLVPEPVRPVVFELKTLYRLAETNQDEVRIARALVEKAGALEDLAWYENLPDFKLGVIYTGVGDPDIPVRPDDSGRDSIGVQVGITIPLWFEKNRGRLDQARAEKRRARAVQTASVNDTRTRVHQLYFRLQNSLRLIDIYRKDLLPQAARSMEIAETWYREGQSSFSDFVETQAVYYNFQLSLARARADYGKYLARLEQVVGQSITGSPGPEGKKATGEIK